MKLYFTHREDGMDDTGQNQMIVLEVQSKAEALTLKTKYAKLFIGKSTIITNRHEEKMSCSEEVI